MFGKIFKSIYDGTLSDDWQALITFQQMIILCDQAGTVDMTVTAMSRRTGIPIEHLEAGIKSLQSPDANNLSDYGDGSRIVLIDKRRDWGWYIVSSLEQLSRPA